MNAVRSLALDDSHSINSYNFIILITIILDFDNRDHTKFKNFKDIIFS